MDEPWRSAKSLKSPQGRLERLAARGSAALFFGTGLAACSIGSVAIQHLSRVLFALTVRQNRSLVLPGRGPKVSCGLHT